MSTLPNPDPDYILRGSSSSVTSLIYLSDSNPALLVSGNQNGVIDLWSLKSRRIVHSEISHKDHNVLSLKQVDSDKLLSQGRDGHIHIWKTKGPSWCTESSFQYESYGFCPFGTIKLSKKDCLILPSNTRSELQVIELYNNKKVMTLKPDSDEVNHGMCMATKSVETVTGEQQYILCGYESGSVIVWDVKTGRQLSIAKIHADTLMCLDYSFKSAKGVSASVDEMIKLWNIADSGELSQLDEVKITNKGVNCIAVRNDSKLFVTGGWDSRIRLFSLKKHKPLAVLCYHTSSIQCVAFSQDNTIAAGSKDALISIWSVYK